MVDLSLVKLEHLWYVVGFMVTDGNLSSDGRHLNLTSKDRDVLEKIKKALLLKNKIGWKGSGTMREKKYSVLQFGDVKFYKFLLGIGLKPKKSLTLEKILVPEKYFGDFLRGVIDGDGSIKDWIHRSNRNIQWSLTVVSASSVFISWLKVETEKVFAVKGGLYSRKRHLQDNILYVLKFGKFAAKVILRKVYYKDCLCLDRKFKKVLECLESDNGLSRYGEVVSDWNLIKARVS